MKTPALVFILAGHIATIRLHGVQPVAFVASVIVLTWDSPADENSFDELAKAGISRVNTN